jgi:hypothetical protein
MARNERYVGKATNGSSSGEAGKKKIPFFITARTFFYQLGSGSEMDDIWLVAVGLAAAVIQ